jgi:hypothetical protein
MFATKKWVRTVLDAHGDATRERLVERLVRWEKHSNESLRDRIEEIVRSLRDRVEVLERVDPLLTARLDTWESNAQQWTRDLHAEVFKKVAEVGPSRPAKRVCGGGVMQCPCPRCKQKRAYVPLMERVRRYVEWCCDRGWKPVLTLPQFRAIYLLVAAGWHIPATDAAPGGIRATLFGSPFTISDEPRPQMRI